MDQKDRILLEGMQFYGYHGLFDEEKKLGQLFIVDLELYLNIRKASQSDRMEDGLHYGEVYECVKTVVEGESVNLIERLAEQVAQTLLRDFVLLEAVKVRLSKPQAPISGIFESVAVEIYREK